MKMAKTSLKVVKNVEINNHNIDLGKNNQLMYALRAFKFITLSSNLLKHALENPVVFGSLLNIFLEINTFSFTIKQFTSEGFE
jgi:hypothetical protein